MVIATGNKLFWPSCTSIHRLLPLTPPPPRCCPKQLDLTSSLLGLPLNSLSGGKMAGHRDSGPCLGMGVCFALALGQALLPGALKSRFPSFRPPFPPIPACPPLCEEFLITTQRKIQNPKTNQRRNRRVVGTKPRDAVPHERQPSTICCF